MPNYMKCANDLFITDNKSGLDHTTGKLHVKRVAGQTYVAVPDKSLNAPKSTLQAKAAQQEVAPQANQQNNVRLPPQGKLKLTSTRAKIHINKHNNTRSVDGIQSSTDSAHTSQHTKPKFFEEIADAPIIQRNKSSIAHKFTIQDGFKGDVWMSSTQQAHNYTPSQYPTGFMSNPGIAAMYSTYAKKGKFTNGQLYRTPCGNK